MKKTSLFFFTTGILFIAGFLGYRVLNHEGVICVERHQEVAVAAPVPPASIAHPAVSTVSQQVNIAAVPHFAVTKSPDQSQSAVVQVVTAPDSRFQPIAEAQIVEQRVTAVSANQKKRELLVRVEGKYPYRRVEETLMKNGADDTYMIAARTEMVANHVLVKLQSGKTEADLRAMLQRYGLSVWHELTMPDVYRIPLKAPTLDAVPEAISVFSGDSDVVAYVEPDYFLSIALAPNDLGNYNLWGITKINATGAWDVATGSTNVVVAVIDTGIDLTHPDLVSNLWKNTAELNGVAGVDDDGNGFIDDITGWDFAGNDKDPSDSYGHGTHCAGTIGAVGNNGQGVVGVCWSVRLMALRAGDETGLAESDIVDAIRYASDKGVKVISASFGGSASSVTMRDAITYANDKSVLFVAAAGNDGSNNDSVPVYPAGYDIPNVVSVAATDENDALASFSNYGKTSVDLAAPGVNIYSTIPNGKFDAMQGTSMACPHVAGAAALLFSANPLLSHLQVKQALLDTVDPVDVLNEKLVSGGRLNLKELIDLQDSDGDGMPDKWEDANGLDKTSESDATLDADTDHLTNLDEYKNRCDPNDEDTDGDSLWDGWEITYGFNPNSPTGSLAIATGKGRFDTAGDAKNIVVSGNYAYVADGANGLVVLDVSNPQSLVFAGSYNTDGIANDVAVNATNAYVADGLNGLVVFNITNKAALSKVGWTNTPGDAEGIAVRSNYVYLADGANELMIFSVTNPAVPKLIKDTVGTLRTMHDIFVQGTYVYLAMNEEVRRFNVANPATVLNADKVSPGFTGWNITGIHGSGSNIVAVAGGNGVKIMNTNLTVLGSYNTDGEASGVFVNGNFAYIADGTNGLVVLNIKTPSVPTLAVRIPTTGSALGVFVSGEYVYVAEGSDGVEVFSVLPDSDGDGMGDAWEIQYFRNLSQSATNDPDSDGIIDWGEYLAGLNPTNADQDADGLIDGTQEIRLHNTDPRAVDTDGDGLVDGHDGIVSTNRYPAGVDVNNDGFVDGELDAGTATDPTRADTDGDGMNDGWEVRYGFDPSSNLSPNPSEDIEPDGLTNLEESQRGTDPGDDDSDNDGMPDGWEVTHGLNPLLDDAALDSDNDTLNNLREYQLGTNPENSDSDADSMPDGWEYTYMPTLNPTNSLDGLLDSDLDGLTNRYEYSNGCSPVNIDSDGDGMPDGWEVNNGLLAKPVAGTNGVNGAYGDPDGDKLLNIQEYSLCSNSLWSLVYTSVTGAPSSFFFGTPLGSPGMPGSTNPRKADSDGDGLNDLFEITTNGTSNLHITNPNAADTDNDGFSDKWEIVNGFDPIVVEPPTTTDRDNDGLTDAEEIALGTQPGNRYDPVFVDDDAPNDLGPQDPEYSDPLEDGTWNPTNSLMSHPFDSIQEAIDSSNTVDGMTILVTNGWYAFIGNYAIDTKGKAITIRSWNGSDDTVVTSLGAAEVFRFTGGETSNTVIKGLSIKSNVGKCSDGDCDWVDIISISNASPVIRDCVISDGGLSGVKCVGLSYPQLINCTIADVRNGIWCEGGAAPLVVSNLIQNAYVTDGWTFDEDWGNGIYAVLGSGMTIRSTTITGCEGRGLHIQSASNLLLEDSTVSTNWGGLRLKNTSAVLRRTRIDGNHAPNYYKIKDGMTVRTVWPTPKDDEDRTFENENGGGILLTDGSRLRLENALIVGNRTWAQDPDFDVKKLVPDYGLGGGLYVGSGCSVTGVNLTVSANIARTRGGGISSHHWSFFRNAIIWGNSAANVYVAGSAAISYPVPEWDEMQCRSGHITVWHGDIGYPYYSDTNVYVYGVVITNDPLFIGSGDYRLSGASPCIDKGSPADAPTNDLAGVSRPLDGNNDSKKLYDFGAYEYFYNTSIEDQDRDGLTDAQEALYGTNPTNSDSDGDGIPDGWEVGHGLNPLVNDGALDPDGDGLTNLQEYQNSTDANGSDSDNDGLNDSVEVSLGTDPLNSRDPVIVDDNAAGDVARGGGGDPDISDIVEDGSVAHPFDSIQEAINTNTTINGMTVLVTNGVYQGTGNFDINPAGKAIRVMSWNGSAVTSIRTYGYGSAFVVNNGETTNTVIGGFTIEAYGDISPEEGVVVNGSSPVLQDLVIHNCELAAVSCLNAAPKILNCRFYDVLHGVYASGSGNLLVQGAVISNTTGRGVLVANGLAEITWSTIENCEGGVLFDNGRGSVRQCIVRNNSATEGAGILLATNSSPLLQNLLIIGNSATNIGGGVYIGGGCNPTGVNCTVADNTAGMFGGGVSSAGRPLFRNMIFWGNTAATNAGIHVSTNVVNIWYSDVQGGFSNAVLSIASDPQFVGGGDYTLQGTSPCIDAGTYYLAPLIDLNGNTRPTAWPSRIDMGCYEFGASAATNPIALGSQIALESSEADPLADTDGDGVSNGDEMVAGTDSLNENDYFRVYHQQSHADGSVLVAWQSIVGNLYTVQFADSLTGAWTNESGYVGLVGTGGVMTFSGSLPSGSRFYRVLVRQP